MHTLQQLADTITKSTGIETQVIGDFVDHESKAIELAGFALSEEHVDGGVAGASQFAEGKFSVPAWSSAVFVQARNGERGLGLPVSEKLDDLPPFGNTKIYIAGDFPAASWDPSTIEVPYANGGLYTVQLGLAKDTGYKFTKGSWDTEISCGGDKRGRRLSRIRRQAIASRVRRPSATRENETRR